MQIIHTISIIIILVGVILNIISLILTAKKNLSTSYKFMRGGYISLITGAVVLCISKYLTPELGGTGNEGLTIAVIAASTTALIYSGLNKDKE